MSDSKQPDAIERFFRAGLKLQQLRILVRLAQLGQVKKVAEAFHVTQPAISKQIAEMEQALQMPLVQRVGRLLKFTAPGEALVAHGREILHHVEQARMELDSMASGLAGTVTVGAVSTSTPVLVPTAIASFQGHAPNAAVSLIESTTNRMFPMLLEGDIDLVVSRTPPPNPREYQRASICRDPIVVVAGVQHPLAHRRNLDWHELTGIPWILPPTGSAMAQTLDRMLGRHRLVLPSGCVKSTSLLAYPILLEAGRLIGLLPKSFAQQTVDAGNAVVLPLPVSHVSPQILVTWSRSHLSPIVQLMYRCLKEAGVAGAVSGEG